MNFISIQTNQIRKSRYVSRFYRDDRPLQTSLQTYGLFQPPLLIKNADGTYDIVDGAARIEWCRVSNIPSVVCQVLDADEWDEKSLFIRILEINRWSRGFNLAEKAWCVKYAHDIFGGLSIPKSFWNIIGIKDNIKSIHQHKEVLKLPEIILKFAVTNNISAPIILGFLRFPRNEIEQIARYILVLPVNQNKLAEILGHLWDISRREETSPLKILDDFVSQLEMELTQVQKEQKLRHMLQIRRNPHFESALKEFNDKVNLLTLDKNTKVAPSPFFEDDSVEIQAKIRTQADLDQLRKSLSDENWNKILPGE